VSTETPLPLPDYDELPFANLQHQVRSLTDDQLERLVTHERAHANRTPVLELLRVRRQELADGDVPAPGNQQEGSGRPADSDSGSPVSPAAAAGPGGPLRHGVAGQTPDRDKPH